MDGTPYPELVKKKRVRKKKKRNPENKKLSCPDCSRKFYFNCQLTFHRLVHTGEKPYVCDICKKAFNTPYSLKNHKYIHTDEKPFKCSQCKYACRDSSTLRKHEAQHAGTRPKYQCKACDKTYKEKWMLKAHVSEDHLNVDLRKLPCPKCDKVFKRKSQLTRHVTLVHDRAKSGHCPVCDLYIPIIYNLDAHLSTHIDARPYVCTAPGCGKTYKDKGTLKKHMVVHSPEDHYPCEICGRMFAKKCRLNYHVNTVHGKRKCVECDYCGVRFYSKNYLIKHIKQKHARKRKKYVCDTCGFKTYNKPSIVMHVKYGHENDDDRECKICHTLYKKHKYLKHHYRFTHNIAYKTKTKIKVKVKDEPPDDAMSVHSIDLFEIDKQEILDEASSNLDTAAAQPECPALETVVECESLNSVSADVFDQFFVQHITTLNLESENTKDATEKKNEELIDKKALEYVRKEKVKILDKARRKKTMENLERARLIYNERMKSFVNGTSKMDSKVPMKVKFFQKKLKNISKVEKKEGKKKQRKNSVNNDEQSSENNEISDNKNNEVTSVTDDNEITNKPHDDETDENGNAENLSEIDKKESNAADITSDDGEIDADEDDEEWKPKKDQKNRKVKFNSHQCYICFKLYETKEELLDHCKDHFDVCNDRFLKKCPLCPYVTKLTITRHMRLKHGVSVKIPYGKIQDKKDNTDGCRYYFELDDPLVNKMEVIPSVKNLNKIASMKIDKKQREDKEKTLAKTKLVKKGKEWVVETERISLDQGVIMPEFGSDAIDKIDMKKADSDGYFDSLKKMYHVAKKSGNTMLFPCQSCDKICRNLAALKLHNRKHEANPKPFRKKVWKHKMKGGDTPKRNTTKNSKPNTANRTAKPKPIKNKHKCPPELKDFYENNIRGGDIEFWQFLKIFNKMGRDNIADFGDLEGKYEYGIPENVRDENIETAYKDKTEITNTAPAMGKNVTAKVTNTSNDTGQKHKKLTKYRLKCNKKRNIYKRVVRISKEEHARRNLEKQKLREKYQNS